MKHAFTFGLVMTLAITTVANAGWRERLGLTKAAKPTTLEQACNTNEITSVCPEMVMGSQTMMECLGNNISSLSSKCAGFVKKQIANKVNDAATKTTETVTTVTTTVKSVGEDGENVVREVTETVTETTNDLPDMMPEPEMAE